MDRHGEPWCSYERGDGQHTIVGDKGHIGVCRDASSAERIVVCGNFARGYDIPKDAPTLADVLGAAEEACAFMEDELPIGFIDEPIAVKELRTILSAFTKADTAED